MGGDSTILESGSWAEVVRKNKKKSKKASFSPTKFHPIRIATTKKTTPKNTPSKIKDLNSEDLHQGQNPKSRSLKKRQRADKAAAAVRYSVTRKPSSKKKPKKKMLTSCEVLTDHYEETSMVFEVEYAEGPKLTMGDFLQGYEMVNDAQCPITNCKEENKAMKNCNVWPMIPSLTGKDLLTKQVDALDATQEHYRTHLDASPSIITTKISKGPPFTCPKTGLVDLDLTNPCTPSYPCLLDKLCINDNVGKVCFECHAMPCVMKNPLHYLDVENFFWNQ